MSLKPVVNLNYFQVKAEGDSWIMNMDEKTNAKNMRYDMCYFCSICVPTADEEALRMVLDWNHWVYFHYDDQFDDGHLRDDPVAAQEEVNATMSIMTDDAPLIDPDDNPLRHVFQICWQQLKRRASPELQQRFREQHKRYFDQVVAQVRRVACGEALASDVQTYMEIRRGTIGVYPAIVVSEYGENSTLPDSIFSHSSLQECMRVSTDLVFLANDVLSHRKDLELCVNFNLISILQHKGLSIQQSIDQIGVMMNDCYRRWYTALAELPSHGRDIDSKVLNFKTGRYLGPKGHEVYKTNIMYL
ncbi:terpenoid synthase [Nemania serpens]|nr:terpenoid synthase [Nemania serpens]